MQYFYNRLICKKQLFLQKYIYDATRSQLKLIETGGWSGKERKIRKTRNNANLICKEILKWKVVPSTDLVEQIEIAMTLLGRFKYRIEISEFFLREITDFCRSY